MKLSGNTTSELEEALVALGNLCAMGASAGWRSGLCYKLSAMQNNLKSAYRYQPKKSTISDHLKDCFGFLC